MASKRVIQSLGIRTSATAIGRQTPRVGFQASRALSVALQPQTCRTARAVHRSAIRDFAQLQVTHAQRRWLSRAPEEAQPNKVYEFQDILHIIEDPSSSILLIDVREPHEFEANSIPTAINIPVSSQPDALLVDEEEFQDRFGFAKPPLNKEVVFFCKAGVRSRASAGIARQAGYTNVAEYPGSWLDWERHGGPGTKTPPAPEGKGSR